MDGTTRQHAIRILNEAKLCSDPNQKVQKRSTSRIIDRWSDRGKLFGRLQVTMLSQLTELVVRKEPGLTLEFVPELVVLQVAWPSVGRAWRVACV